MGDLVWVRIFSKLLEIESPLHYYPALNAMRGIFFPSCFLPPEISLQNTFFLKSPIPLSPQTSNGRLLTSLMPENGK